MPTKAEVIQHKDNEIARLRKEIEELRAENPSVSKEDIERAAKYAKTKIREEAATVRHLMERLIRVCDNEEYPIINSLGELQGIAASLNAYCGRYSAFADLLKNSKLA